MAFWGMDEKQIKAETERLIKEETRLKNREEELNSQERVFTTAREKFETEKQALETEKQAIIESMQKNRDKIAKENKKLEERKQELTKLEAEAKNNFVQAQNEAFKDVIETRISALDERKKELDELQKQIEIRLQELSVREGEIAKRDLVVTEREQKADAGFADKATALAAETKRQHEANIAEANRLKAEADSLARKLNELKSYEETLVKREDEIRSAEIDREHGYTKERSKLDQELAQKRADAEKSIAERKNQANIELESEISTLRAQKWDSVSVEMDAERKRVQAEIDSARAAFLNEKSSAEQDISQQRTALEKLRGTLSALESELVGRKQQLEQDEKRLERQEERNQNRYNTRYEKLDDEVADRIQEEKANFEAQLADSKKENARLLDSLRTQSELLGAFEVLKRQLGDQDPSEVILKLRSQADELTRLREELATRPTDEMRTRFEALDAENKNLKQKVEEIKNQLTATNEAIAEVGELKRKNSELTAENKSLEQRASLWEAASNEAQEELQRLRATYERKQDISARYAEIEMPFLENGKAFNIKSKSKSEIYSRMPVPKPNNEKSEIEWLEKINKDCREEVGISINSRIVKAFHTSLKIADWAPITVLAGVSGTGKSELPKLYSHFGGLFFMPLAVQPNWDSQESMLGFFNSIDNKFDAQNVLRFLAQSQKEWGKMDLEQVYIYNCNLIDEWAKGQNMDKKASNYIQCATKKWIEAINYKIPDYPGLNDAVCMVLLDEMNLAHPELYFAEFLSKLELRRGYRSKDAPFIDVKVGAGIKPYKLPLGRNVLWTGTMNQDETTKSLSDKVLDRSIVIHFPRPTELKSRQSQKTLTPENRGEILHRSIWESWIERSCTFTNEEILPFKTYLEDMNSALGKVGRAIGHRVWQSVEYYMANYPDVRDAKANGDKNKLDTAMHIAFEDQLVQKVMPKLRGIDTRGDSKTECLDKIRRQIDAGVNGEKFNLGDDFDLACELGYGQFIWQSANYLKES